VTAIRQITPWTLWPSLCAGVNRQLQQNVRIKSEIATETLIEGFKFWNTRDLGLA